MNRDKMWSCVVALTPTARSLITLDPVCHHAVQQIGRRRPGGRLPCVHVPAWSLELPVVDSAPPSLPPPTPHTGDQRPLKNTEAQDALAQSLVDGIAQIFVQEVKDRRGTKLKPTPDMFSGRVWLGPEAVRLGLIDSTTTFEELRDARFKDLPIHEFRPKRTLQDALGMKAMARELGVGLSSGFAGSRWE